MSEISLAYLLKQNKKIKVTNYKTDYAIPVLITKKSFNLIQHNKVFYCNTLEQLFHQLKSKKPLTQYNVVTNMSDLFKNVTIEISVSDIPSVKKIIYNHPSSYTVILENNRNVNFRNEREMQKFIRKLLEEKENNKQQNNKKHNKKKQGTKKIRKRKPISEMLKRLSSNPELLKHYLSIPI